MNTRKLTSIVSVSAVLLLLTGFGSHYTISSAQSLYQYNYMAQSGDTLSLIGTRFQVSWQSLAAQNGISSPYTIYVGEHLTIPLASTSVVYTVQSGDYLTKIAQEFEVNWQSIASVNGIPSPYNIYVGEKLVIPLVVTSTCSYQGIGGADGSGWWCWTASTNLLSDSGLTSNLQGVSKYFGTCLSTLERDNGYTTNVGIWNGETLLIPNGSGCPRQAWVWLWNNYSSDLAAIAIHPKALTTVSPNTYQLNNDGTFGLQTALAEVCPQVHSLGLQCVPLIQSSQSTSAGINALLTSSTLETNFINNAVNVAINSNLDGYNVDFEPSPDIGNVSVQFGVFLSNFASAMHAHGKTLSVDVASWNGAGEPAGIAADLWNFKIEAQSKVDLILTMETYDTNVANFQGTIQTILKDVPAQKLAVGLLTESQNDANLNQEFGLVASYEIPAVMVWPSYGAFLTPPYWDNMTNYLRGFN
jgi:LysM repeat protein